MIELYQKFVRIANLVDTNDLTDWEADFITSNAPRCHQARANGKPMPLSEKQIEVVERIYKKHFA